MGRLRAAGLVQSEKRGLWIYYRLRDDLASTTARLIDALVADGPSVSGGAGRRE
jgi:DNA-binding transcriptional ArsR family regulator